MRIAIVGSGISGLVAAHRLYREHDVTVFERGNYIGGHTNTIEVALGGRDVAVDTGFIVFNERTYPNFCALLDELGVESQPTQMSFSVRCDRSGLEYNGNGLNALFAQRRNLVRPAFYRMVRDILRFNRDAIDWLDSGMPGESGMTLGAFVAGRRYGRHFVDQYLVPMGAAIWSTEPRRMYDYPAAAFLRFFRNHGLLALRDRPQWRSIVGGSARYVEKLTAPWRDRIRLSTPVTGIARRSGGVAIRTKRHGVEQFDHVFLACHSDQALALIDDASETERELLSAIPYQPNEAVLHTDTSMLPRRRRAWAAWNYHLPANAVSQATLTYNMNILQRLDTPETLCVTLNDAGNDIDPGRVLYRTQYDHPLFLDTGLAAQTRRAEINGVRRTWFCGAYWGNGFHEDGVKSALTSVEAFTQSIGRDELYLRRAG